LFPERGIGVDRKVFFIREERNCPDGGWFLSFTGAEVLLQASRKGGFRSPFRGIRGLSFSIINANLSPSEIDRIIYKYR
jgi:hypothetical protein